METSQATPRVSSISARQFGEIARKLENLGIGGSQINETVYKHPETVAALFHGMIAQPELVKTLATAILAAPEQLAAALEALPYARYGPFLFTLRGLTVDPESPGQPLPAGFDPHKLVGNGFYPRSASADIGRDFLNCAQGYGIERFGQDHMWWALNHPDEVPPDWFCFVRGVTRSPTLVFPGTRLIRPDGSRVVPAIVRRHPVCDWITLDPADHWDSSTGCLCERDRHQGGWVTL